MFHFSRNPRQDLMRLQSQLQNGHGCLWHLISHFSSVFVQQNMMLRAEACKNCGVTRKMAWVVFDRNIVVKIDASLESWNIFHFPLSYWFANLTALKEKFHFSRNPRRDLMRLQSQLQNHMDMAVSGIWFLTSVLSSYWAKHDAKSGRLQKLRSHSKDGMDRIWSQHRGQGRC